MHIAEKYLKCLLVSLMRDGKQTSTVFGKHFHLLGNIFSHMGFVCVAYCMLWDCDSGLPCKQSMQFRILTRMHFMF